MKQKRKHILKKFLIFGIAFLLASCSEELYEPENTFNKQGIKISKVSLKEPRFQIKSKLINQVNKVKRKQELSSNSNRMVYDSINNFYFDDENGMLIETASGYESYTFKIEREISNSFELENIVFSKVGNEYDVSLVKYELTPTEQQKLESNISFNPVVEPSIEVLGKVMDCNTKIDKCVAGIDENGNYFFIVTFLDPCTGSGGGGTGTGSAGSGTGSGTGSGSSGTNSGSGTGSGGTSGSGNGYGSGTSGSGSGTGVSWQGGGTNTNGGLLTVPTGGSGGATTAANPCKKFKKQKDELPALQQALINLEATTSQNHENGIFVDSNSPNVQNATSSTTASSTVEFPNLTAPNKYKIMAHTHDAYGPNGTGTFSIFSWGDILQAADIIKENENDDDFFTYYLATADGTRYALTIDWPSAFYEVFDINTNPDDPTQTNYFNSQKLQKIYNTEKEYYSETPTPGKISYTSNPEDDLKVFLKMMKELKLNASLFEVDQTYTTFTKLSLNSDGTVKRGTPCN